MPPSTSDLEHRAAHAFGRMPRPARRLTVLTLTVIQGVGADRGTVYAAAISYRVLFSIFPLALGLVAISGFLLRDDEWHQRVLDAVESTLPLSSSGQEALSTVLDTAANGATTATLIAIPGLLWAGSGMIAAVRMAVDTPFGREDGRRRTYVIGKTLDLAFVLGMGLLGLVSIVLTVLGEKATDLSEAADDWPEPLSQLVDLLASAAVPVAVAVLSAFIFWVLYRVLPAHPPRRQALWAGVLLAAAAFEVLKRGFAIYVTKFADYASVYGSLGTVIAFLFFVYLAALIVIVGAEVSAAWRQTDGGRHDPFPRLAAAVAAADGTAPPAPEPEPEPAAAAPAATPAPAPPPGVLALLRGAIVLVALALVGRLGRRG